MAIAPIPMPRSARPGGYPAATNWWDNVGDGLARNSKSLIGLGTGLLQGRNFAQGLALAGEGYSRGSMVDDAYAKEKKSESERQERLQSAIENIRTKYNRPEIADWLTTAGPDGIDSAWNEVLSGMKPKAPLSVGAGEVLLDPTTYEELYTAPDPKAAADANKDRFSREKDLTAQYTAADPIKTYTVVRDSYERVRQSAAQNTGAGDMGLIYGYMKMLDPGSVVRESEFAMAAQAGSFGEQIQGLVSRVINGERLPETVRRSFVANADKLYQEAAANAEAINEQFSTRAGEWDVDPTRFIRPVEEYEPLAPGGIDPEIQSLVDKYTQGF